MSALDWRHRAVCRDEDPELFFPVGNTGPARAQAEEAKRVCYRCPVMERCLEWALDSGQTAGVWGGLDEDELRLARRRRRNRRSAPCGTRAAYQRHQRNEEPIDDACRRANTSERRGEERQLAPCGTQAAYRRHLRHEDEICGRCREANRLAQQDKADRRTERVEASA